MNRNRFYFFLFFFLLLHNFNYAQTEDELIQKEFTQKGWMLVNKAIKSEDSTVIYYQKAIEQFEKAENKGGIAFCYNNITVAYYNQENTTEAFKYGKISWEYVQQHFTEKDLDYLDAMSNMASYYQTKGDFETALTIRNKHITSLEKVENNTAGLMAGYHNLGYFYQTIITDYHRAYQYLLKVIDMVEKMEDTDDQFIIELYSSALSHAGHNRKEVQKYDEAISFCKKSIKELSKIRKEKFNAQIIWYNYQSLAEIYFQKNQLDSAKHFTNLAFKIINEYNTIFEDFRTLKTQGDIFLKQKQNNNAIASFKKSVSAAKAESKVDKYASTLNHLADVFFNLNDVDQALNYYQQGLVALSSHANSDNLSSPLLDKFQNPKLESILYKKPALEIIQGKANAFFQKYKNTQNQKDLLDAFENFSFANKIIQKIRQDYTEDISKFLLAEKVLSIYENAIDVALELYKKTNDPKYKKEAFYFAECNKSVLLMESIRDNAAKGFGILPDSILEKENKLKIEIAFLNKQIFKNKQSGNNFSQLQATLFEEQEKKNRLIAKIEKDYPKYHHLKYGSQKSSIEQIQNKTLDNSTALLEFFVGEKNIYLFAITKNNFDVQFFKKNNSLEKQIQTLRTLLSTPPLSDTYKTDLTVFQKTAQSVYDFLLKNTLVEFPSTINHLIIIPDDFLNYLPFEILIISPAKEVTNDYLSIEYLLKKYSVGYSYSSKLFLDNVKKNYRAEKNLVAFAPSYNNTITSAARDCTLGDLSFLKCNQQEIIEIEKIVKGNSFLGKEATKSSFEKITENVNSIHLATHACIDEDDEKFNRIYFQDDFLSNFDLTNMKLQANLAVLSACNTGSGKLIKGEGVMSLCKGFTLAGVPSVVTSLWSIDDCSTSEIMVDFYKNLSAGKSKDVALRNAKLDYLKNADVANSHPYYWAAFLQFGNSSPLQIKNSNNYFLFILIGVVVFLIGFYFLKK